MIESALARPRNRWAYAEDDAPPDVITLAAAYGFGLARNHGFRDGNKRVAFMAMYVFLGLNGHQVVAEEPSVVQLMHDVASGNYTENELADWLRSRVKPPV